jgi:hypothetical protein
MYYTIKQKGDFMAIKKECFINIKDIDFISVKCKKCGTEVRYVPKGEINNNCPGCGAVLPTYKINQLIQAIKSANDDDKVSASVEISLISKEDE